MRPCIRAWRSCCPPSKPENSDDGCATEQRKRTGRVEFRAKESLAALGRHHKQANGKAARGHLDGAPCQCSPDDVTGIQALTRGLFYVPRKDVIMDSTSEEKQQPQHEFDDDACCVKCGFDGADWWHWRHRTHEGLASKAEQPPCKKPF